MSEHTPEREEPITARRIAQSLDRIEQRIIHHVEHQAKLLDDVYAANPEPDGEEDGIVDDPRAEYWNLRTCMCGVDARHHTKSGCGGFDPDWEAAWKRLHAIADSQLNPGAVEERAGEEEVRMSRDEYRTTMAHIHEVEAERDRYEAALRKIYAEAPTRVTAGDWDGVDVSEIAGKALEEVPIKYPSSKEPNADATEAGSDREPSSKSEAGEMPEAIGGMNYLGKLDVAEGQKVRIGEPLYSESTVRSLLDRAEQAERERDEENARLSRRVEDARAVIRRQDERIRELEEWERQADKAWRILGAHPEDSLVDSANRVVAALQSRDPAPVVTKDAVEAFRRYYADAWAMNLNPQEIHKALTRAIPHLTPDSPSAESEGEGHPGGQAPSSSDATASVKEGDRRSDAGESPDPELSRPTHEWDVPEELRNTPVAEPSAESESKMGKVTEDTHLLRGMEDEPSASDPLDQIKSAWSVVEEAAMNSHLYNSTVHSALKIIDRRLSQPSDPVEFCDGSVPDYFGEMGECRRFVGHEGECAEWPSLEMLLEDARRFVSQPSAGREVTAEVRWVSEHGGWVDLYHVEGGERLKPGTRVQITPDPESE